VVKLLNKTSHCVVLRILSYDTLTVSDCNQSINIFFKFNQ